tara:strand:+ start:158 stop:517 length:360 start_codon:yes stop_codon:yes gene_type:complete
MVGKNVRGDKLDDIEEYERIKRILIDFLRGYPSWRYYGIFEYYFKERGKNVIKKLKNDGFINVKKEGEITYYWLTSKGVQLASSFRTKARVDIGIILVGMTVVIGLAHYLLSYAQFPLF